MSKTLRNLTLLLAMTAVIFGSRAQTGGGVAPPPPPAEPGPAGNAHPDSRLIGSGEETIGNPFGEPLVTPALAGPEKAAFADAVDVGPLRDLAVFHNGRVKIVDTLARESVEFITGKTALDLPIRLAPDGDGTRVDFDPVFTLLDLMIDPAFYVTRPTVHVNYLPLREAYLDTAFPDDPDLRRRWKRLTRVSPAMVLRDTQPIFEAHAGEEPYRAGIGRVEQRIEVLFGSHTNLMLIAPETPDVPWHHVSEWPEDSPVRSTLTRLGTGWRTGDADAVNAAIADLAGILPTINASMYPETTRRLEFAYNRGNFFEWGYWAYFVSLVSLVLAFGTGRGWLRFVGQATLLVAVGLHTVGVHAPLHPRGTVRDPEPVRVDDGPESVRGVCGPGGDARAQAAHLRRGGRGEWFPRADPRDGDGYPGAVDRA
ncbi:MAG: hypothetical protein AAF235_02430 [Planctomycetota bacterium]